MPVKESCLKYKGVMSYIRRSHFSHERIVGKDIICPWKSHVSNISKSYLTYKGVMSHRNGWQGKTLFAYQGVMPHIWLWRISHDMHVDDTCSHSYVLRIFANMCIKSTKNIWQCVAMFWRVLPLVTTAGPNTSHSLIHHTATHCNTLQHTATHCNTLQRSLRGAYDGVPLVTSAGPCTVASLKGSPIKWPNWGKRGKCKGHFFRFFPVLEAHFSPLKSRSIGSWGVEFKCLAPIKRGRVYRFLSHMQGLSWVHGMAEQRIGGTCYTNSTRTTDCLCFTGTHFARGIIRAFVIILFTRNAYYRAPYQLQITFLSRITHLLASNHTHNTSESA